VEEQQVAQETLVATRRLANSTLELCVMIQTMLVARVANSPAQPRYAELPRTPLAIPSSFVQATLLLVLPM
jgi:hypothetical protein